MNEDNQLTADEIELLLRWAETIDYDYGLLSEKEVALRAKLEALQEIQKRKAKESNP